VLLPDGDLPEAEAALGERLLGTLIDAVKVRPVKLWLPKVSLDRPCDLTELLGALGVRTMFGAADLRGISPDPLSVSQVLHQAVLRLDEDGFEGAAATAVIMTRGASMSFDDPIEVKVDRPFLLLVRHPDSGAVYFFARVVEP
jgi:serpin B